VEYNDMADVAPNTTQVTVNTKGTGNGVSNGAVSYSPWTQTWYSIRYGVSPGSLNTGVNTIVTTANPDTCEGLGLIELYKNPAESTNNVVDIAEGEFAWHYEENGQVLYGYAPYDTRMDWSCLDMSCGTFSTRVSALGGAGECNGTTDQFEDQIETWGSGPSWPPLLGGEQFGGDEGSPAVWSGPPGALNCKIGSGPDEIVRDYYPPNSAFNKNGQAFEWGFYPEANPSKSTYWQQAR
jgi:hypothetical protein